MNKNHCRPFGRDAAGLTLLEIIVTLVIVAILAAVMVQFVGSGVQRSSEPLKQVAGDPALAAVMELFTAEYQQYRQQDLDNGSQAALTNLKSFIDTVSNWQGVHPQAGEVSVGYAHVDFNTGSPPVYSEIASAGSEILKVTLTRDGRFLRTLYTLR